VVDVNDQADDMNVEGAGDGDAPLNLGMSAPQNPGPSAPPTSLMGGMSIDAQLSQAHEIEAKLPEEYRAVRLLHASIA
jgi:hypothetical protein